MKWNIAHRIVARVKCDHVYKALSTVPGTAGITIIIIVAVTIRKCSENCSL